MPGEYCLSDEIWGFGISNHPQLSRWAKAYLYILRQPLVRFGLDPGALPAQADLHDWLETSIEILFVQRNQCDQTGVPIELSFKNGKMKRIIRSVPLLYKRR